MLRLFFIPLLGLLLVACSKAPEPQVWPDDQVYGDPVPAEPVDPFVRAVDFSALPEIESVGAAYKDSTGKFTDPLEVLKSYGVNTIRIKLWHTPEDEHASLEEVKTFATRVRAARMRVWITVHYSDTWADPGQQLIPEAWRNLPYETLKDSLSDYTARIAQILKPDYIQIGNEINSGFLFPVGSLQAQETEFLELLTTGIEAVRANSAESQIMLHYAGFSFADNFFEKVDGLDYDLMALSYYPWWHGKILSAFSTTIRDLQDKYNRPVIIAETAYPFTLDWFDWTNNIVGLENQLVLPDYPATPEGQRTFLKEVRNIVEFREAAGFCYWGAELTAYRGPISGNGSPWENLALFDFDFKPVPALEAFARE